jgi:hypothetical protein
LARLFHTRTEAQPFSASLLPFCLQLSGTIFYEDEVHVADFGIRGLDMAYALLDSYDVTIFVDATPCGEEPGTLYVTEPGVNEVNQGDGQAMMGLKVSCAASLNRLCAQYKRQAYASKARDLAT